jgi:hypothetical protein
MTVICILKVNIYFIQAIKASVISETAAARRRFTPFSAGQS